MAEDALQNSSWLRLGARIADSPIKIFRQQLINGRMASREMPAETLHRNKYWLSIVYFAPSRRCGTSTFLGTQNQMRRYFHAPVT